MGITISLLLAPLTLSVDSEDRADRLTDGLNVKCERKTGNGGAMVFASVLRSSIVSSAELVNKGKSRCLFVLWGR